MHIENVIFLILSKIAYTKFSEGPAESHESDPPEISDGFKELEEFLCELPLEDNNAVFNLCCRLCSTYERKAFIDGLQYGAHLMKELSPK